MAALSINALQRQISLLSAPHPKRLFVISQILGDTWPDPTRVSRRVGERTWEWGSSLHGLYFNMTEMHHWWLLFWEAATWLDIICTKKTSWLQSSGICDETNAQKLCCWHSNFDLIGLLSSNHIIPYYYNGIAEFAWEIAWFVVVFGINTTSDILKLWYVIWDNFEISRVVFMPNISYKSRYYLFILLPAKGL